MQLIEAALAFAITMLALSLVVSSFVEIIHRIFSMREAGLKHVLRQMFDQVLAKHVVGASLEQTGSAEADRKAAEAAITAARDAFVARMSANRAPMGAAPRATATHQAENAGGEQGLLDRWKSWVTYPWNRLVHFWEHSVRLWNGRALAAMTPAEFMERLGSMEVGHAIAKANIDAKKAAEDAGATAAEAAHVVLKDVAQKFEAFGKEASVYFEGRARLLSVVVAMALAFLAHVDAIDLFKTYLRDPNARAKVIEQSGAVTAQHKAATDAAEAVKKIVPDANAAPPDVKAQLEKIKQDWTEAIGKVDATVKQYADLGVPLGWTDERIKAAEMWRLLWTCTKLSDGDTERFGTWRQTCRSDEEDSKTKQELAEPRNSGKELNYTKHRKVWLQVPTVLSAWFYLFLGGLLIGLGAPFWYDAVVGLTNIRNGARGTTSADAQMRAAVVAPGAGTTQPVTPVDAFRVSHAAQPKPKEG
ncbi:hypothetical protein [Bradyrhizobium sp. AZCC 1693]|uniref:hypothetical protein n=1 Tax=Bradyrhizobium sp. AZCC 1693 TaxID=3117029 RepID=UPI002FF3BF35